MIFPLNTFEFWHSWGPQLLVMTLLDEASGVILTYEPQLAKDETRFCPPLMVLFLLPCVEVDL